MEKVMLIKFFRFLSNKQFMTYFCYIKNMPYFLDKNREPGFREGPFRLKQGRGKGIALRECASVMPGRWRDTRNSMTG